MKASIETIERLSAVADELLELEQLVAPTVGDRNRIHLRHTRERVEQLVGRLK